MKFRTTILVAVLVLIAGMLGATLRVVEGVLEREARAELSTDLDRSAGVLEELQRFRQEQLAIQAKVTAAEPRVKAVIATDDVNHETVLDVAQEIRESVGAQVLLMTDGEGKLLADTQDPKAFGHDLSKMPLVAEMMEKGTAGGVWTEEEKAYQVHAHRIAFGPTVVGSLIMGYVIDDAVAETIRRQTGSSVRLMVDDIVIASADDETVEHDPMEVATVAGTLEAGSEAAEAVQLGAERFIGLARPLPGYAGERNVRYVVLRSLDNALAAAGEVASRLYQVAAGAFGVAVVFALFLAGYLGRPVDRLTKFTESIAHGNLTDRLDPTGPVEIKKLGSAMNVMAGDLQKSREEIERINAGLEDTVEQRTAELRTANSEISEMLDNLHDAIFIIDDELAISSRFSPACKSIFGIEDLAGKSVADFLFVPKDKSDEKTSQHVFSLQTSIGAPEFQWEVNSHCLLDAVEYERPTSDGRTETRNLTVRYAPLYNADDEVERIMLVVADVTEVLKLRKDIEEEQRRSGQKVEALLELTRAPRSQVLEFLDDARDRLRRSHDTIAEIERSNSKVEFSALLRELHTVKGNARALGLKRISATTHEVESTVQDAATSDVSGKDKAASIREGVGAIESLHEMYDGIADETLRGGGAATLKQHMMRVRDRVVALGGLAGKTSEQKAAAAALSQLLVAEADESVVSVNQLFHQQERMVSDVAGQLGKQAQLAVDDGRDLYVVPEASRALRDAFNHGIRNALDHGLEGPEGRSAAGKSDTGTVRLSWKAEEDGFALELKDDGSGIDVSIVRAKAIARGVIKDSDALSDDATIELLFTPQFSTKDAVTDISGRGVGLDAVRTAVRGIGGEVRLRSASGKGASLAIRLPRSCVRYADDSGVIAKLGGSDSPKAVRAA